MDQQLRNAGIGPSRRHDTIFLQATHAAVFT